MKKREPLDDDDCQHVNRLSYPSSCSFCARHGFSQKQKKGNSDYEGQQCIGIIVWVSKSNIIIEIIFVLTRIIRNKIPGLILVPISSLLIR